MTDNQLLVAGGLIIAAIFVFFNKNEKTKEPNKKTESLIQEKQPTTLPVSTTTETPHSATIIPEQNVAAKEPTVEKSEKKEAGDYYVKNEKGNKVILN